MGARRRRVAVSGQALAFRLPALRYRLRRKWYATAVRI